MTITEWILVCFSPLFPVGWLTLALLAGMLAPNEPFEDFLMRKRLREGKPIDDLLAISLNNKQRERKHCNG